MNGAKFLPLALLSLAASTPAAMAQIVVPTVVVRHVDSIRLKIERMTDPGVVITEPACPSGVPVPGVSVTRSNWPGQVEFNLPPTPAMCLEGAVPGVSLTGVGPNVRAEAINSQLIHKGENIVVSTGGGRVCSAVNTVGQGC